MSHSVVYLLLQPGERVDAQLAVGMFFCKVGVGVEPWLAPLKRGKSGAYSRAASVSVPCICLVGDGWEGSWNSTRQNKQLKYLLADMHYRK